MKEPYKISEVIERLQELQNEYGDLDVYACTSNGCYIPRPITSYSNIQVEERNGYVHRVVIDTAITRS